MQPIALCLGGGAGVWDEYRDASALLAGCGRAAVAATALLVCNDMIGVFPGAIDHAVTLHPIKMARWLAERERAGRPAPARTWSHRPFAGIDCHTPEWAHGSSGLFLVKIARELGFERIILAGIPMSAEHGHFLRNKRWDSCIDFRRRWDSHVDTLRPYVRSLSGWTLQQFGAPDRAWLEA